MDYFVREDSIVRKIWGKADTILFIFAGSSAEFALNKAVDWLYFTGALPADPIGRLFSTVVYARMIVFSETAGALKAIDSINAIHSGIEKARGKQIPQWAYRDVLFMLIGYSIRSYEVLERKLTDDEKQEVFDVFYRMGIRMNITDMPQNYAQFEVDRATHLHDDLIKTNFTIDLYKQYRKHLGWVRYQLLRQVQLLVCPGRVKTLLKLNRIAWVRPVLAGYKLSRLIRLDGLLKETILPRAYKKQIKELDK